MHRIRNPLAVGMDDRVIDVSALSNLFQWHARNPAIIILASQTCLIHTPYLQFLAVGMIIW